jgi:serine/threonine protein kinase
LEGNAATRSLNPEFLQAAEELFFQALAMPSLQRDDFLQHRCGDQSHLFSFVNRLLAHYESSVHVAANDHSFAAHDEPDSPLWESGTLIAGRYRITRVIGSGGMGRVYEAQDEQLPRKVALKGLHRGGSAASPSKRFEREARALSRMGHHHIASIIDSTFEGEQRVLVLEYVEGGTIGDRIRSNRLPVEDVLLFAEQLFHALAAAHEKGILHGDLKPDNLGISEYGSLKVLDFGLSTLLHEELAEAHASEANPAFAGTPAYMSPELFLGHPPSVTTDLFSAGIVLYEMLTGSRPADTAGLPHNFSMIA